MEGASVYIYLAPKDVGPFLHMLEDMDDVFPAGQTRVNGKMQELELRSLRFPSEWHGREVGAVVNEGAIERFVPVLRGPGEAYHNGDD